MLRFRDVWCEINLNNLENNLGVVREQLDCNTKVLAVVKADAYGHGLCEIAERLSAEGVDYFGVASINEGASLVEYGISQPVLVLRSVPTEKMAELLKIGLIPSINCISLAKEANLYGKVTNKKIKIHIKVDSGDDSEGMSYSSCTAFFDALSDMKWIEVEGIYTHITSAYGHNEYMIEKQLERFKATIDMAKSKGIDIPLIHAASSPAIFKYPHSHFNMVRVGTALYGIPFEGDEGVNMLKPVMQLKSRVMCIKEYENGCNAGYGSECTEFRKVRIAYVSIGYADAPFLLEAENLNMLIGGTIVKLYGKAFMDYIKVDIEELDVNEGDEVVIFGTQQNKNIRMLDTADACGIDKINCESICFHGKRVVRVFCEHEEIPASMRKFKNILDVDKSQNYAITNAF